MCGINVLSSGNARNKPGMLLKIISCFAPSALAIIAAARSVGAPARFVSGYLASESEGAERAAGAGDLRGWAEAHVEGLGWIGFDPSICLCMHDGHVRLAAALDYLGAAPLRVSPVLNATRSVDARATFLQGQSQRQS